MKLTEARALAAFLTFMALVLTGLNVFLAPPAFGGLETLAIAMMFFSTLVGAPLLSLSAIVFGIIGLRRDHVTDRSAAMLWLQRFGVVLCLVLALAGLLFFFGIFDFGITVPSGRYRESVWGE